MMIFHDLRSHSIGFGMLLATAALMSTPASAECANHPGQQKPRVCAEYYYSDAVFEGTVVSTRQVPTGSSDPANIMGWFYTLEISKPYRGLDQRTVEVYAGNDSSGIPLQHGHAYILFAKKDRDGHLEANSCGSSAETSKAAETLAFLNKLVADSKTSTRGEIGGRIVAIEPGTISLTDTPVPGVHVTAQAGGKTYTDISDAQGKFHIGVPSGKYTVSAASDKWNISPYALSYSKPDNVIVENAGCADLDLLAEPRRK